MLVGLLVFVSLPAVKTEEAGRIEGRALHTVVQNLQGKRESLLDCRTAQL
jgi:predicted glycosyltransferase